MAIECLPDSADTTRIQYDFSDGAPSNFKSFTIKCLYHEGPKIYVNWKNLATFDDVILAPPSPSLVDHDLELGFLPQGSIAIGLFSPLDNGLPSPQGAISP